MPPLTVNIKNTNFCAFCKHWYDPTNSAIEPKNPIVGLWKIRDDKQKNLCLKKNLPKAAHSTCGSGFELKL